MTEGDGFRLAKERALVRLRSGVVGELYGWQVNGSRCKVRTAGRHLVVPKVDVIEVVS